MPPPLSLVMIVRDEAELLPRFLKSVEGLWDELCVVDTGSKDATVSLLESAGAKVTHRPWKDDFSDARNASLAMATGDWVLFLDPDEFVSPEARKQIRALVTTPDIEAGAASIRMRNGLPNGSYRDAQLLRLFRREPEIRFEHRIHEDVSASVAAMLARTGRRMFHVDGLVHHEGYVRARAESKDKRQRDSKLIQSALKKAPDDLYLHFKLLEQARFWNDKPLAASAATEAQKAMQAAAPKHIRSLHFGGEMLVLMSEALCSSKAPNEALNWLEARQSKTSPSAPLTLRLGELRERKGDLAGAARDFQACLTMTDVSGNVSVTHVRPLLGLARVALAKGHMAQAKEKVSAALSHAPLDAEALLAQTALLASEGGPALEAWRSGHVAENGDTAELWTALGEHALLTGRLADAATAFSKAEALGAGVPIQHTLARLTLALGEVADARQRCEALAPKVPDAVLGIVLCDLFEGKSSDVTLELEPDEAQVALKTWVEPMRFASPMVRVTLAQVAPALAEPFPWLPAWATQWVPSSSKT